MKAMSVICPASEKPCLGRHICDERRLCARSHYAPIHLIGETYKPLVHFVGFRGEEYHSAVRVFGLPDVYHRGWDMRAQREIAPADTVVFANRKDDPDKPHARSYDDSNQDDDPAAAERKATGARRLVLQTPASPILTRRRA